MGTDGITLGSGSLCMMDEFGTPFLEAPVYDMSWDIAMSADAEANYNFEFRTPLAQTFTTDTVIVDTGLLNLISDQPKGFFLEYDVDIQIQARRHHKKRINKKWLKRYGYKTVRRRVRLSCEEMSINQDDGCCNIDVEGVMYV